MVKSKSLPESIVIDGIEYVKKCDPPEPVEHTSVGEVKTPCGTIEVKRYRIAPSGDVFYISTVRHNTSISGFTAFQSPRADTRTIIIANITPDEVIRRLNLLENHEN